MDEYIKCEQVLTELENATSWTDLGIRIDSIPAADVAERKTGKWIELPPACNGAILTQCSSCKRILTDAQLGMVKRFCPNCGARMIGGDDDG